MLSWSSRGFFLCFKMLGTIRVVGVVGDLGVVGVVGVVGGVRFVAAESEGRRMRVGQEKFKYITILSLSICRHRSRPFY